MLVPVIAIVKLCCLVIDISIHNDEKTTIRIDLTLKVFIYAFFRQKICLHGQSSMHFTDEHIVRLVKESLIDTNFDPNTKSSTYRWSTIQ